jgi:ADP-ribose pyrophosphatase YjhB (NUDIX family)
MRELDGWKFCPRCRTELRLGGNRVDCENCGFVAYANPKPTASAIVLDDDGKVLLGRRAIEPYFNAWDAPGGFVEEDEHPLDALRRELLEETGLEIEPVEFLGIWMDRYEGDSTAETTLNLFWTARILAGEPRAADDVSELGWFEPDKLPPDDELAFECVGLALVAWRNQNA